VSVTTLIGDCREVLRTLPDRSVHCVASSPPYWGLRDYAIAPSVWGGDLSCDHDFTVERVERELRKGAGMAALGERYRGGGHKVGKVPRISAESGFCRHCGAWSGCLGLEPTYQLYIEHMIEVARELWRVLRDDGTMWLNLGDCYAGAPKGHSGYGTSTLTSTGAYQSDAPRPRKAGGAPGLRADARSRALRDGRHAGKHTAMAAQGAMHQPNRTPQPGLKPKDLCGIPWRVAFALQDEGWWLRRDIVWAKPAPMPESVRDRCTTAHEYIFMFAKNGRAPLLWVHRDRGIGRRVYERPEPDFRWVHRKTKQETSEPQQGREWRRINLWSGSDYYYDFEAILEPSSPNSHARAARGRSDNHKWADGGPGGQTIAREPPSAGRLVGIGSNARPSKAVPNEANGRLTPKAAAAIQAHGTTPKQNARFDSALRGDLVLARNKRSVWTVGTEPFPGAHFAVYPTRLIEPCILAGCPAGGTVLDPFAGAGTTGLVADRLQRDAILIELNPAYAEMARSRIERDAPLFSSTEAAE